MIIMIMGMFSISKYLYFCIMFEIIACKEIVRCCWYHYTWFRLLPTSQCSKRCNNPTAFWSCDFNVTVANQFTVKQVWPCFFSFLLKISLKSSLKFILPKNPSRNVINSFLCQGERFREIRYFLYVLGNSMYKRICPTSFLSDIWKVHLQQSMFNPEVGCFLGNFFS